MFADYPSLLITKLAIPHPRTALVPRPALLNLLRAGTGLKLILVAASAGSGKTSLIVQWLQQNQGDLSAGWLSLDAEDNDPTRFLSYFVAAVQSAYPDFGQALLGALQSQRPPSAAHLLPGLVNQLAALPDSLVVVLDDYHVIDNTAIHDIVSFLVANLPPNITLAMLTRSDPSLPMARLRVRNELLELRADALRFSEDEAFAFLNDTMGLRLTREAVAALEGRTEGWIAGLQLAAIALRTAPASREAFVRNFTGSHRFILDYLVEEVLQQQPDDIRQFLLQTSFLERFNGALCGAVCDRPDGATMLEYLERNNLFLIPLDEERSWYRYHHLFADLLQACLLAEAPGLLPMLRSRAAHWCGQHDLAEEAIRYALAAADYEYAAALISSSVTSATRLGTVLGFLGWYKAFPPGFMADHPRLALNYGLAFAFNGRWSDAETLLGYVEPVYFKESTAEESAPVEALLLSYFVAAYHNDVSQLASIASAAARRPPSPITRLVQSFFHSAVSDWQQATLLMAEAQLLSEQAGDHEFALTALFHQCRFNVFLGNLRWAEALSFQALERIEQLGNSVLPLATITHVSLGRIYIEWQMLDKAAYHLQEALRIGEQSGFVIGMLSSSTLMLAEVQLALGNAAEANRLSAQAMTYAEQYDPPHECLWLRIYQARLWLIQGNSAAAADCLLSLPETLPPSLFYPESILPVTQARLLLAQRKTDDAIDLLAKFLTNPPDLFSAEAQIIIAFARLVRGDAVNAQTAMTQAVRLAEPEQRVHVFLELGQPALRLLSQLETTAGRTGSLFIKGVLNYSLTPSAVASGEQLTNRELDVLRLIVAGRTNDEIARELVIAASTVKWYVNTLYAKLHVKTRGQAIARVHELNLLLH